MQLDESLWCTHYHKYYLVSYYGFYYGILRRVFLMSTFSNCGNLLRIIFHKHVDMNINGASWKVGYIYIYIYIYNTNNSFLSNCWSLSLLEIKIFIRIFSKLRFRDSIFGTFSCTNQHTLIPKIEIKSYTAGYWLFGY